MNALASLIERKLSGPVSLSVRRKLCLLKDLLLFSMMGVAQNLCDSEQQVKKCKQFNCLSEQKVNAAILQSSITTVLVNSRAKFKLYSRDQKTSQESRPIKKLLNRNENLLKKDKLEN